MIEPFSPAWEKAAAGGGRTVSALAVNELCHLFYFSTASISCPAIIKGNGFSGRVCGQGANLSCLIDKAQKRTPPELILEPPIGLVIAPQEEAPAQLVPPTTHGFDLLTAATLKNRSEKTIISYRIGWGYVLQNGMEFHTGAPMSVPAGVKPGRIHNVPGQGIHLAPGAEQVIFFVAELTFANGDHWTAKKGSPSAHGGSEKLSMTVVQRR